VSEFFKLDDAMGTVECMNVDKTKQGYGSFAAMEKFPAITIAHANRLLKERGTVVYGYVIDSAGGIGAWLDEKQEHSTHQAIVINVTPIEKDTAESLLRSLVDYITRIGSTYNIGHAPIELIRAKRLLNK
jgi:hypothetical protein